MAAFVAACRAEVLSERTIEFYLEGLNAYRTFARSDDRDLTLADVDLGIGRAWLADFVERGRKPATVAARAHALRVFSHGWILYLRGRIQVIDRVGLEGAACECYEVVRDAFARLVGPPLTRDGEALPVAESLRLA